MLSDHPFTKDNLDQYLKELAKEFRRRNGKSMPAEIILIGGAAVIIHYSFREMTYDMDAIILAASSMKDAINYVGDKYNLPKGWINTDFMRTSSYTPKISTCSKYYRTFSNVIVFRTVYREYLVAMKLMAGRRYKYDLSDVVGILLEHEKRGDPITLDQIGKAAGDLYGSYEALPEMSRAFLERVLADRGYEALYQRIRKMEAENKNILLQFQEENPGVTKSDNVNEILESIRKKKEGSEQGTV